MIINMVSQCTVSLNNTHHRLLEVFLIGLFGAWWLLEVNVVHVKSWLV